MRFRGALFIVAIAAWVSLPTAAQGQKVIDLTVDMLDRWFTAHDKEKTEIKSVESQLTDADAKINKFEQCKRDWEAAGAASGSRMGGLAARIAIKAKCGSSDSDGMRKDRQKILDGPENAAAAAGGFKLADYRNLKDKLQGWLNGDESGFSRTGLDLLKSRKNQLASAFGVSVNVAQAGAGRGMRGPGVWTNDFAWMWISQLFTVQYLSGATMFEKDYKPGEWTRWQVSTADNEDVQTNERAFLGRQADRGEWWRMKTIMTDKGAGTADTVVMEALFRPDSTNEYVQTLVRMRGKFPGNAEAQEMMVPEQWAMWNMAGTMPKPTKESIDGATVGTESVTTPAGTFRAKHVRFGGGGGTLDWWLDETSVGGWVKFSALDNEKKPMYTMELVAKGTGAKSELGVTIK
ncbi:MAG: hypothetical protein ACRENU_07435 [Gemmatimonadaceae bacterium]